MATTTTPPLRLSDLPAETLVQIAAQLAPDHLGAILALRLASRTIDSALEGNEIELETALLERCYDTKAVRRRWQTLPSNTSKVKSYIDERRASEACAPLRSGAGSSSSSSDDRLGPTSLDLAYEFRKRRYLLRSMRQLLRYFQATRFRQLSQETWMAPGTIERLALPRYISTHFNQDVIAAYAGRRTRSKSRSLASNPSLASTVLNVLEGALVMILEHDYLNIPALLAHDIGDLLAAIQGALPVNDHTLDNWDDLQAVKRLPPLLMVLLGSYIPPPEFAGPRNRFLSASSLTQDPKIIARLCAPGPIQDPNLDFISPSCELRRLAFVAERSTTWHDTHDYMESEGERKADPSCQLTMPLDDWLAHTSKSRKSSFFRRNMAVGPPSALIHLMFFALSGNGSRLVPDVRSLSTPPYTYYPPFDAVFGLRIADPPAPAPATEAPAVAPETGDNGKTVSGAQRQYRHEGTSPLVPLSIYFDGRMTLEQPAPLPSLKSIDNDLLWTTLAFTPDHPIGPHCDYFKGLLKGRWSGHYLYSANLGQGHDWDEAMSEADNEDYQPPEDETSDIITDMESLSDGEALERGADHDLDIPPELEPTGGKIETSWKPQNFGGDPTSNTRGWHDPIFTGQYPMHLMMPQDCRVEDGLDLLHYTDRAQRWNLIEIEDDDGGLLIESYEELEQVFPRAFGDCNVDPDLPARIIRGRGYDRFGLFELWGVIGSGHGKVTLMKTSSDRHRQQMLAFGGGVIEGGVILRSHAEELLHFTDPEKLNQTSSRPIQPLVPLAIDRTSRQLAMMGVDRGFDEPSWIYHGSLLFGQNGRICLSGSWLPPDPGEGYWGPFFMVKDTLDV